MLEEDDVFFSGEPATSQLPGRQFHPTVPGRASLPDPVADAARRAPETRRKLFCRIYFSCHFRSLLARHERK